MSKKESSGMNRREFIRNSVMGAGGLAMAGRSQFDFSRQGRHKHSNPQRPNIVLMMVDDMGFSDVGCYGSNISTPAINSLSANGVNFTQFYNTSRCCPSRASLLTGLDHHQAGMGLMTKDKTKLPGYKGHLVHERCVTIAQLLRKAGYGTYMTGKWHLGLDKGHQPLDWGFDRYYGCLDGAISYFEPGNPAKYPHHPTTRGITLDRTRIDVLPDENFYSTNRFGDYSRSFIDQHLYEREDDPFFLYFAPNAPHWPLQALPEVIKKYEGKYLKGWDKMRERRYHKQLQLGLLRSENTTLSKRTDARYRGKGKWPSSRMPIPAWDSVSEKQKRDSARRMAVYAAVVDLIDQNVNRLVNFLKEKGQFDNTIFLFLSDNGGAMLGGGDVFGFNQFRNHNIEEYGTANSFISYGPSWGNVSNTPFRMYKCYVEEGGISSPLIVHWPDGIGNSDYGSFVRTPTHLLDIMPTLLEAAGAEYPDEWDGHDILENEGQSLTPFLKGHPKKFNTDRILYWEHAGSKAVRDGKWKLEQVYQEPWELYNMAEDRCETNNLIDQYPNRAKKMERLYHKWAKSHYVVPAHRLKEVDPRF